MDFVIYIDIDGADRAVLYINEEFETVRDFFTEFVKEMRAVNFQGNILLAKLKPQDVAEIEEACVVTYERYPWIIGVIDKVFDDNEQNWFFPMPDGFNLEAN
jgi:hypothetical protein